MSYKDQIDVAEQLLRNVSIPTLPKAILELQNLFEEYEIPPTNKIKNALVVNPFLAGELVGLANIPALTNSSHIKISDIDTAIHRLGTKYLKNYVMAITIKELLNKSKINGLSYHSQVIAKITMEIARYNKYIRPDEAYLLGLIHDIGTFALAEIDENYGSTFVNRLTNHFSIEKDEEARFGTTHSAIGYALAHSWNVPSYISQTLLLHHSSNINLIKNDKLKSLVALIELAHSLSIKHNQGKQENDLNHHIYQTSKTILNLSDDDIINIRNHIK